MSFDEVKGQVRAAWSVGDYSALASVLEPAAASLVDACAVSAGQEVLDVGAGSGNFAVFAAREGASVVASDLTPAMVELGRDRCASEGLDVEWVEADVEDLPFPDQSFECVGSVFGAMFAPSPQAAASEMFRVVRPGGTVGMANWTPDGFQGRLFDVQNAYRPPQPEGAARPLDWGDEAVVRERFEDLAATLEVSRPTVPWRFDSAEAMWEFFAENAGPLVLARKALPPDRFEAMRSDALAFVAEWTGQPSGPIDIDAEYLLVVARRRG